MNHLSPMLLMRILAVMYRFAWTEIRWDTAAGNHSLKQEIIMEQTIHIMTGALVEGYIISTIALMTVEECISA